MVLLLLARGLLRALEDREKLPVLDLDDLTRGPRIRCPRCAWEPRATDRWQCACEFMWNTFDTRGQCPACDQQWEDTQCLACGQWSRHEDWYTR